MPKESFQNLLKNDRYQVFLFSSPASIPVSFERHHWFVTNRKGELNRYEVIMTNNRDNGDVIHLFKNYLPPYRGIGVIHRQRKWLWGAKLMGMAEGGDDSFVHRMVDAIENSRYSYPRVREYKLFGPNSNTYVEWILEQFPEFTGKLAKNALGKAYALFK
jgi:hypothetical protein